MKEVPTTLPELVLEFFRILDIEEESEEGRLFRPTYISSCRALDSFRLGQVLERMKALVAT